MPERALRFRVEATPPGKSPLLIDPLAAHLISGAEWVWEAFEGDEPVGSLLAELNPNLGYCTIPSLFVEEKRRGEGVAGLLLGKLEERLRKEKISVSLLSYCSSSAPALSFSRYLLKKGWSGPRPYKIRCHFDQSFSAPWLFRLPPLPADLIPFPWEELTKSEKQQIVEAAGNRQIPDIVSPLKREDYEPIGSMGLRRGKRVVGWMLTKRESNTTLSYQALYIDKVRVPEYGVAAWLLAESIKKQLSSAIPLAICDVNLLYTSASWHTFILKRIAPYSYHTFYYHQIWQNRSNKRPSLLFENR